MGGGSRRAFVSCFDVGLFYGWVICELIFFYYLRRLFLILIISVEIRFVFLDAMTKSCLSLDANVGVSSGVKDLVRLNATRDFVAT